ncbi:MAG TPA: PP2C family protein-serine/threonine phosphatase, partial [Acidimicrobiales bacterium]|nr:PP2C family protein-serine/threonine phosphatase [Acidimicrobiales bacterium]
DDLLGDSHLAAPHELAELLARHAEKLGVTDALAYLVDLQQSVLVPFLPPRAIRLNEQVDVLGVDSTIAGRAYQHVEVVMQELAAGGTRVWIPLLDGTERLGVLGVTVADPHALEAAGGLLDTRLRRFASLAAELIMTKSPYGDTLVRLKRRSPMGLAAEMQWALLPPLTFACQSVTIASALEPAYEVAGDSVDYAVDPSRARFAVFDGMGHGLGSAQLAVLAIAAYRNARRANRSLSQTARAIEIAVHAVFGGQAFTTAVLAELDTDTGSLTWVNAGHPEPLLLRAGRLVKSLHLEPSLPFGLRTGLTTPGDDLVVGREQLEPGDRVLLYTDGVTEARSPEGEHFGVQRLTDLLGRNLAGGLPTPETMRRVVRSLMEHQQGQLDDDATMLLVEWCSGNKEILLP